MDLFTDSSKPTLHCYNCGRPLDLKGLPGRSEKCLGCGADLRVCRNCVYRAPKLTYQCSERRAEEVVDPSRGNFCEYFDFAKRIYVPIHKDTSREEKARENIRKLFDL